MKLTLKVEDIPGAEATIDVPDDTDLGSLAHEIGRSLERRLDEFLDERVKELIQGKPGPTPIGFLRDRESQLNG